MYPFTLCDVISDTRWCCRVVACVNIGDKLDAFLAFLYTVTEDCTDDKVIEAKGLLALTDFKFVLLLHVLRSAVKKSASFCGVAGSVFGYSKCR